VNECKNLRDLTSIFNCEEKLRYPLVVSMLNVKSPLAEVRTLMSTAALQYNKFKQQVAEEGKVFTFTIEGEYLVFPVRGQEVIPFWSSRRRTAMVQKSHQQYQRYEITEMGLDEFIEWFPKLAKEGIYIGTNWSGNRLEGYDVSTQELQKGIEYWLNRDHEEKK
jgi:hypothetical protein